MSHTLKTAFSLEWKNKLYHLYIKNFKLAVHAVFKSHVFLEMFSEISIFRTESKYLPEKEGSAPLFVSFFVSLSLFALHSEVGWV